MPAPRKKRHGANPCTTEISYSDEERDFLKAVERYKRLYGRPFPTWHEVLEVVRALGYRRVAEPTPLEDLPPRRR